MKRNERKQRRKIEYKMKKKFLKKRIKEELKEEKMKIEKEITGGKKKIKIEEKEISENNLKEDLTIPKNNLQVDEEKVRLIEECPMCLKEIKRPMRLKQCSRVSIKNHTIEIKLTVAIQGHIVCDDCFLHLRDTARKENKGLCIPCRSLYLPDRPVVLERVLGLLDSNDTLQFGLLSD